MKREEKTGLYQFAPRDQETPLLIPQDFILTSSIYSEMHALSVSNQVSTFCVAISSPPEFSVGPSW